MQMTDELFDWRLDSGMHTWKVSPDQCYVFFPWLLSHILHPSNALLFEKLTLYNFSKDAFN